MDTAEATAKTEQISRKLIMEADHNLSRLTQAKSELYELATRISGSFPFAEEKRPSPKEAPNTFVDNQSLINMAMRDQLSDIETIIRRLKEFA